MSKIIKTNENTESSQPFFEEAEPVMWKDRLYCMGCGAYVGNDEALDDLEFDAFGFMCLDCKEKVRELRRLGRAARLERAAERVDKLIKSIAEWG